MWAACIYAYRSNYFLLVVRRFVVDVVRRLVVVVRTVPPVILRAI